MADRDAPASSRRYRTSTNGALEISILGYLGLRQMEEIGKPFHYPAVQ